MTEAQHIADALSRLFVTRNAGWFVPFTTAVSGLTAAQAAQVPGEGFNSVWAVVNHVNFWHDIMIKRVRDIPVDKSVLAAGQGWEQPADANDEAAWQAICERAVALNGELVGLVAALDDEALNRPVENWNETLIQALHGLLAHNSYHICEIVSVRHQNGFWLENT